ncbi:unnamed protein product [Aphanomyces euteiches]|nr:hypothetical protein AeRB84_004176 [Aphanomyces euteiches]
MLSTIWTPSKSRRTTATHVTTTNRYSVNPKQHFGRHKALARIVTNLVTFNAIVLISLLVIILATVGFFYSREILDNVAANTNSIAVFGHNCQVDVDGFKRASCSAVEMATTTEPAWAAIGKRLALQWQATSTLPCSVTTCI